MINNNDYEQLTQFLHGEFQKINTTYGVQNPPEGYLTSLSKSLLRRYKDVNSLERKKLKFNIKVEWAKYTMPHGFFWKLFHRRLWLKVKEQLNAPEPNLEQCDSISTQPDMLIPEVASPVDLPAMSYPSMVDDQQD